MRVAIVILFVSNVILLKANPLLLAVYVTTMQCNQATHTGYNERYPRDNRTTQNISDKSLTFMTLYQWEKGNSDFRKKIDRRCKKNYILFKLHRKFI